MKRKNLLGITIVFFLIASVIMIFQFFAPVENIGTDSSDPNNRKEKLNSEVLFDTAKVFSEKKQFFKSNQYLRKFIKRNNDEVNLSDAYQLLGENYSGMVLYNHAIKHYNLALNELAKDGRESEIQDVYTKIGYAFYMLDDIDKAEKYYLKSDSIRRRFKLENGMGSSFINLGVIEKERGRPDKAIEYYRKGITFFEKKKDTSVLLKLYNNISNAFKGAGRFKDAEASFSKTAELAYASEDNYFIALTLHNMACLQKDQNAFNQASKTFKLALEYIDTSDRSFIRLYYPTLTELVELSEKTEDFEAAFHYSNLALKQKEKQKSTYQTQFFDIRSELEISEKNRELEYLKATEIRLQQGRVNLIIGFLILLGSAILIYYLLRKQLTSERELVELKEKEMQSLSSDLTNYAIYALKRSDFVDEIKLGLKKIGKMQMTENTQEALHKLTVEANDFSRIGLNNLSLERRLSEANRTFYKNLRSSYPDLSDRDVELCGLLRLQLSSKEISSIMNIEPKSVEMARYRLRKKLSLSKGDELHEIIKKMKL